MIAGYSHIGWVSRRSISKMLISVLCLCLWASQAIAADDPQAVIKTGTEQVLKLLKKYPENTQVRREKIRVAVDRYVDEYFDFDEIAKHALEHDGTSSLPKSSRNLRGTSVNCSLTRTSERSKSIRMKRSRTTRNRLEAIVPLSRPLEQGTSLVRSPSIITSASRTGNGRYATSLSRG